MCPPPEDLEWSGHDTRCLPGNGRASKGLGAAQGMVTRASREPASADPKPPLQCKQAPYHLKPLFCQATYAALSPSTVRCNILSVELEEKVELA